MGLPSKIVAGLQVLLVAFLTGYLGWLGSLYLTPIRAVENWLTDLSVTLDSPRINASDSPIVIVAITEDTLSQMAYRSPVDRLFMAELLSHLDQLQPRAIGIDVLFDQATEPFKDKQLQETLQSLKTPVYVAWATTEEGLTQAQFEFLNEFVPSSMAVRVNLLKDDSDGVVRTMSFNSSQSPPSLASVITNQKQFQSRRIAWYRGELATSESPFATYPAHMVKLLPKAWFKDKIVLIGADLSLTDRHITSLRALLGVQQGRRSGVEIHAQMIQNSLMNFGYKTLTHVWATVYLSVFALLGFVLGRYLNGALFKIIGFFSIQAIIVLVMAAFLTQALLVPWFVAHMVSLVGLAAGLAFSSRQNRTEKLFIRKAMSHYVAPEVVTALQKNPALLKLGGSQSTVSILFTDIAGFTVLSESLEPERLVRLLNFYLDRVSQCVVRHGGIVDKFIGDAVVALFNVPINQKNHAESAVLCAFEVDQICESFREELKWTEQLNWGQTRVGVHTAEAIVGNMGGLDRFDYTAVGSAMNLASRLEGANKYLNTRVCISQMTIDHIGQVAGLPFELTPVRPVQLQGFGHPVMVFTIMAKGIELDESLRSIPLILDSK